LGVLLSQFGRRDQTGSDRCESLLDDQGEGIQADGAVRLHPVGQCRSDGGVDDRAESPGFGPGEGGEVAVDLGPDGVEVVDGDPTVGAEQVEQFRHPSGEFGSVCVPVGLRLRPSAECEDGRQAQVVVDGQQPGHEVELGVVDRLDEVACWVFRIQRKRQCGGHVPSPRSVRIIVDRQFDYYQKAYINLLTPSTTCSNRGDGGRRRNQHPHHRQDHTERRAQNVAPPARRPGRQRHSLRSPRPSNRVATSLRVTRRPGAVSKHVANVFLKLGMTPSDENRRVRAVLAWLRHTGR